MSASSSNCISSIASSNKPSALSLGVLGSRPAHPLPPVVRRIALLPARPAAAAEPVLLQPPPPRRPALEERHVAHQHLLPLLDVPRRPHDVPPPPPPPLPTRISVPVPVPPAAAAAAAAIALRGSSRHRPDADGVGPARVVDARHPGEHAPVRAADRVRVAAQDVQVAAPGRLPGEPVLVAGVEVAPLPVGQAPHRGVREPDHLLEDELRVVPEEGGAVVAPAAAVWRGDAEQRLFFQYARPLADERRGEDAQPLPGRGADLPRGMRALYRGCD
ncbi:uncharacterized protein E0L32_007268 [Thyridium curvatum]|uniref:Uncharacterized protein n=1 Tax=Thyridium curvatum TaxID=1093900 RepID=A0A507AMM8_9PEZI|nr:uncharacterized protein E0L32_007268 [Thyridium curvatum]TPX11965.1 hypothetical protein E0L32_007268 [Thyridium curvatum]